MGAFSVIGLTFWGLRYISAGFNDNYINLFSDLWTCQTSFVGVPYKSSMDLSAMVPASIEHCLSSRPLALFGGLLHGKMTQ